MFDYFQILIAFVAIFLTLYYYFTLNFNFWKNRNVIAPKPIPFFGNTKDVILRKIEISNFIAKLYKKYDNEAMFGIFFGSSPNLVLRDLDLIKDVLIKDFSTFDERGFKISERVCIFFFYIYIYKFFFNISKYKKFKILSIF